MPRRPPKVHYENVKREKPSVGPSGGPSAGPNGEPSGGPSVGPSMGPSGEPSEGPSGEPSGGPSGEPSERPSVEPGERPNKSGRGTMNGSFNYHITTWPALLLFTDTMKLWKLKRSQLGLLLRAGKYGVIVLDILPRRD